MVVGFRQSDEFSFGLQPAVREMEGPVTSTRSEKKKQDVRTPELCFKVCSEIEIEGSQFVSNLGQLCFRHYTVSGVSIFQCILIIDILKYARFTFFI